MTSMVVDCLGYGIMGGGRKLRPSSPGARGRVRASPLPQSPPSPAFSDSPLSPVSPDGSVRGQPKNCGVCGDLAKSMHFGGLSCDSCKAFFRRSVQNNAYKGFNCPYEKKCSIMITSRKACQYCRFHKCLTIGMEKGWVMTEDERKRMMQQREERKIKQQIMDAQVKEDEVQKSLMFSLSEEDSNEIEYIVSLYKKAYKDIPYKEFGSANPNMSVMGAWMTFCQRITHFFSLFSEYSDLSANDQYLLLGTAMASACIIMGSVAYDTSAGKVSGKSLNRSGYFPNVTSENVEKLVPNDLWLRVESFFKKFQQICPDETMAMILILVSLYSPELMGLEAREAIQNLQDKYIQILNKYMRHKFREKAALMFPKAIVSLADIRELAERTFKMILKDQASSLVPEMFHSVQSDASSHGHSSLSNFSAHTLLKRGQMSHCPDSLSSKHYIHDLIKMHGPSLLIVQIVKKIGASSGVGDTGTRTISSNAKSLHSRKFGTKRRLIQVKEEMEEVYVKQEIDDDPLLQCIKSPAEVHSPVPPSLILQPDNMTMFDQDILINQNSQLPNQPTFNEPDILESVHHFDNSECSAFQSLSPHLDSSGGELIHTSSLPDHNVNTFPSTLVTTPVNVLTIDSSVSQMDIVDNQILAGSHTMRMQPVDMHSYTNASLLQPDVRSDALIDMVDTSMHSPFSDSCGSSSSLDDPRSISQDALLQNLANFTVEELIDCFRDYVASPEGAKDHESQKFLSELQNLGSGVCPLSE